jgi:hypothetical protein
VTLYRPEAYERLTDARWDEGHVRDRIRAVVAAADAAWRGPKLFWKAHPWDGWHGTSPMKNLYVGTAGVLWGLDRLRNHAETSLDLRDLAARNVELFRASPDYLKGFQLPGQRDSSLFLGETGILLVAHKLGNTGYADDLHRLVHANVDNEAEEVFWGSPGTLLAARALYAWTAEERWRVAWNEIADALLARRDEDGLWTQRLYKQVYKSLTPPHGLVGNVQALLPLLEDERAARLKRDSATILARSVHREGEIANWPPRERPDLPGPDGEIRVQWCAGSPGIVIAAADYLDEDLLLAGAELPWRAGPPTLEKGPNICHGTAGNGYAFLKAFARTGDERWLDRARRFALHALEQVERSPGRYSLFTGDVGVAIYAADCIEARADYPIMEYV